MFNYRLAPLASCGVVTCIGLLVLGSALSQADDLVFKDSFEHICPTYYEDADQDSYGDDATASQYCENPPQDWILMGGDCDDGNGSVNPGAADDPDLAFLDTNCDSIDGDLDNSIFADSSTGNDGNDGLTPATAVFGVGRAYERAVTHGRDWILISAGTSVVVDEFVEGKNLAGGYDAASAWSRSSGNKQVMTVANTGALIDGWTTPTTWQLVTVDAQSSPDGSSIGMRILNTSDLLLENITVTADIAGDGTNGSPGDPGAPGNTGSKGDDGAEDEGGLLCRSVDPDPVGGKGAAPLHCGGWAGGNGGNPGYSKESGLAGAAGGPELRGGLPGDGGLSGQAGEPGLPGDPGQPGTNGIGGEPFGSLDASGLYLPSDGDNGAIGGSGEGGGGGGGGGGGTTGCDSWGGGGGGGGSGGCGGTGGQGGAGGMASIGIVLLDSSIEILNSEISSNWGGFGGNGSNGGPGGNGGKPGSGGAGQDDSGAGGNGGAGGAGGRGGHGGGGGGGPSIGVICVGTSNLTNNGSIVLPGLARPGGSSTGNPGATGEETAIKDC